MPISAKGAMAIEPAATPWGDPGARRGGSAVSSNLHVSTALTLTYDHHGHCIENAGIPVNVPLDLPPQHKAWTAVDHRW